MLSSLLISLAQSQAPTTETRSYSAWLVVAPGEHLRFGLELTRAPDESWRAFLVNGEERIEVPHVELDERELWLDMPHYDSRIRATVSEGAALTGTWVKRRGPDSTGEMPFHASLRHGRLPESVPPPSGWVGGHETALTGRWSVRFGEDEPAVAVLTQDGERVRGTFLTPTGDYRYLEGAAEHVGVHNGGCASDSGVAFSLSCFDGAHAFHFRGELDGGSIHGDFWSGNWHHETWTAKRDDSATLADPFAQTRWNGTTRLADLAFPDLDGVKRPLGELAGKATLLVVFGSWCPNCHDEAGLLRELDARYRARGLRILGLAFELTGEFARDAEQVRRFAERHALAIPTFLCGTADKAEATRALGLVDRVRAFPTTVFVGGDGLVKAVHSGFAGPATGEEHAALRREFERRIEELLGGS